jgi:hypothetical protein
MFDFKILFGIIFIIISDEIFQLSHVSFIIQFLSRKYNMFQYKCLVLPRPQALIKKFHASHYMKGLHEVVHHIIAQRAVAYERSG